MMRASARGRMSSRSRDVGLLTTGLVVETTPDEARGGHHERGVGFRAGSRQAARSCETG